MKKKIILVIAIVCSTVFFAFAQMNNPVSWRFKTQKSGNNEFVLTFYADIDAGWYLYSQNIGEGGPIPTTFKFIPSDGYELIGKVVESEDNKVVMQDDVFDMELIKFHDFAVFTQKIRVADINKPIEGMIQYMSCNGQRCTRPVEEKFKFSL